MSVKVYSGSNLEYVHSVAAELNMYLLFFSKERQLFFHMRPARRFLIIEMKTNKQEFSQNLFLSQIIRAECTEN